MRKAFALRISEDVLAGIKQWAADDLRSVNAQIEFLLARALKEAGRDKRRREGGRKE
jgi:hypothetical protein